MNSSTTSTNQGRRFQLEAKLGAGAFGEVLLAEMEGGGGFRRKVALKLLHPDMAKHADVARRMRDEARILGRLIHRHIVAVLDLVRLDDRWAIVMDYVPGADLDNILVSAEREGTAVPAPAALEIVVAILRALHAAFEARDEQGLRLEVVHRDIKPSNVRLTADGDVKVLDFGVARFRLDTREADTRASGWIGTEIYMAPERILCEGDTPAGDVYAVGATAVELLLAEQLGRTPVREEPHTSLVEGVLEKVRAQLAGPQSAVDGLVDTLRAMLHVNPEDRPTAEAAASTLDAIARQLEGESLPAFAQRVVPGAEAMALSNQEPAAGVLVERGSSATLNLGAPTPTDDSMLRDGRVLFALGGAASLALVAGIIGFAGLGVAAWLYLRADTSAPLEGDVAAPGQAVAAPLPSPPGEPGLEPSVEPEPEATLVETPPDHPVEPANEPEEQATVAPVAKPTSAAAAPAPSAADVARIVKTQFAVKDAAFLRVTCGDRSASGTASLRLTDFPAGPCAIEATYLGTSYRTEGTLDHAGTVQCTVTDGELSCSW